MKKRIVGIAEITAAAILFGIMPLVVKSTSIDAYSLSAGRILVAAAFLALWALIKKSKISQIKEDKKLFFAFGALHALIILFAFIAVKAINIPIASVLIYAGAIYLVPLSAIFLKEKLEKKSIIALIISLAGLIVIFWTTNFSGSFYGYLVGFISGILIGVVYLIGKILSKKHDKISMALIQNLIAVPITLPLFFIGSLSINLKNIVVIFFLGIFCTALPFILLYSGMKKIKGQKIGVILMLEIITPIILSVIFFSDIPSTREIIGGSLILIGYFLIALFNRN